MALVGILAGCGGRVEPLATDGDLSAGDVDAADADGAGGAAADDTADADADADGDADGAVTDPADEAPKPVEGTADNLPGCDLASQVAPAIAGALAETVRTDAVVGPAVLTEDDLGGRTLTATLVVDAGVEYVPVSWAVDEDDPGVRLLPLTEAALEVSSDDADTSRLLGADEEVVLGDTPGTGGMALGYDCSLVLAQQLHPPAPPPAPEIRDDLIVATPATVLPGAIVELTFPEQTDRGVAFQLDEQVGGEWLIRWWMTSDGNGGEPLAVRAGTTGHGWEDVGVGGPGPDRVLVHPDTEPGSYRLCTANAADDFCTSLEVTSG